MIPAAPLVLRRGGPFFRRLLPVALLVLAGCRADALITISVEGRGGEVGVRFQVDPEAVSIVGGPGTITQAAQVSDLRAAGWKVSGPRRTAAGGAVVQAVKRYSRPADLGTLIEELSGPEGPLDGFHLDRHRSLSRVRYRLSGAIDLAQAGTALSGFGNDPGLARRLAAAGIDAGRVADLLAQRAAEGFRLAVVVDLPGKDPVRFVGRAGISVSFTAASSDPNWVRPALLVVAGGLGIAAIAVFLSRRRLESGLGPVD